MMKVTKKQEKDNYKFCKDLCNKDVVFRSLKIKNARLEDEKKQLEKREN